MWTKTGSSNLPTQHDSEVFRSTRYSSIVSINSELTNSDVGGESWQATPRPRQTVTMRNPDTESRYRSHRVNRVKERWREVKLQSKRTRGGLKRGKEDIEVGKWKKDRGER